MKSIIILASLFIALATSHCNEVDSSRKEVPRQTNRSPFADDLALDQDSSSSSLSLKPATGRVLARRSPRAPVQCNIFPRVCRGPSSPGPDCCWGRCVDVDADRLNCGWCGRRCGYGETCCGGRCVNVLFDLLNCGGCRNKCEGGSSCRFGMCSYA